MKKIGHLSVGFFLLGLTLAAQPLQVPLETIRSFAGSRANVIWGDAYPDDPLPLYSLQDEVIGYAINFSIGSPFPSREDLMEQCDRTRTGPSPAGRWMEGLYGNMVVSATTATSPLVRFSECLSDEYACGLEIGELARAKLQGKECVLYRVYLMNLLAKWYCYRAGEEKVYVKIFPPVEVLTETEFRAAVKDRYHAPGLWQLPADVNDGWGRYFGDSSSGPLTDVLLTNEDLWVPFYDWSYGCTPTAFSMALAYWDNSGMSWSNDYGNLVKSHMQRHDHVQGDDDKNVPDLQKALAIAMNTDSMSGGTGPCCWLSGFINTCTARGYAFTGSDLYGTIAQYWAWAQTEINAGRTFHMGTPGHSSTGVGYSAIGADNFVIVHNTWHPPNDYFNINDCDLVGTIIPGGQYGAAVQIIKPFGDPRYSDYATLPNQGEDLYAGDMFEITWNYDYLVNSTARLWYSTDAGYNWNLITSGTDNDGLYDWRIPSGIAGTTLGRVKVEIRDAAGTEASDGSWGNFDFHTGGSLAALSEDVAVTAVTDPDYFQFTNTGIWWNVVGIRPDVSGEDWDMHLFDDTYFTSELASSMYGGSVVDFVVVDGNHASTLARGVKADRWSGSGSGRVEWEGGTDMITVTSPVTGDWTAGDVVEMFDVDLAPGYYKCTLVVNSGSADLGMAFFNSNSTAYYAGRSSAMVVADTYGAGAGESFWVTITEQDYYGLCLFANNASPANITVKFETQGQWLGQVSHDWFDPANWSAASVPTSTIWASIVTGYTYYPIIGSGTANCSSVTIGPGAKLSIGDADLNVNGNMEIFGQVEQTHYNADFNVTAHVIWETGSTANITDNGEFHVQGDWEFRDGSAAVLANGYVYFEGSASYSYIRNHERSSAFRNVLISKSAGEAWFSSASTDTLNINGYLYISTGNLFNTNTYYPLILKGQFYNYGHITCPYGTVIFQGPTQNIDLNAGDYFSNLVIHPTTSVTLQDSLRVNNDLAITSGSLIAGSYPILVGGNWNNSVGTTGFSEGTGKVVFTGGIYHQACSGETFNILEVNNALDGALRINGGNVTCAAYDWTSGAVDVLSGSFTANDLLDNGIFGRYYLNPGGTINLHNTNGWIDLNGYLYLYGGNFNIWGGLGSDSYWPYSANAGITMTDGVLDFKDYGVFVSSTPSYTFTEDITGGTIRTAGGFQVERTDYTPSGGTVEFYGPTDVYFHAYLGGYVYHVLINKGASDQVSSTGTILRNRNDNSVTEAPLTSTVIIDNTTDINGSIVIQNGTLMTTGSSTIYVAGNWTNTAGSAAFNEGISAVEFDGAGAALINTTESFFNLYVNKTYAFYEGLTLTQDVTCQNLRLMNGTMELNSPADLAVAGDLTIEFEAGLNANDSYGPQISVGGHWTNDNYSYSTEFGFDPGSVSTVTFNGTNDQLLTTSSANETFGFLRINKSGGKFRPNDHILCFQDMEIVNGIWEDNVSSALHHTFNGDFTVQASGAFYNAFPLNTVEFGGSGNAVLAYLSTTGYFHNIIVNKDAGYGVTQAGYTSCQSGGSLQVNQGQYNLNGNNLLVSGDITINNQGKLTLPTGSVLTMTDNKGIYVNSGGRLEVVGTSGTPALIQANVSTARYHFTVNSGATIAAEYGTFRFLGPAGVNVTAGAIIDPAFPFKGCRFQYGAAGGTLLTIDNSQVLTIRNANFPPNTWSGSYNVTKNTNTGHVYFVDFIGSFSGEDFDNDAFNLIDWVPTLTATATAVPAEICAGSSSQLNAGPGGGKTPYTYLWSPATGLSSTMIINPVASPAATTTYSVTVTDNLGTTVTSSVPVTVKPYLPVSVTITASANPSPPGDYVTFTAHPVNGGTSPSYQWKVNGLNVGSGLSTYSYVPSYNDQVKCVMTSNYLCTTGNPATSNTIVMIIVPVNTSATGNVTSGLSLCFDASNTVTVAGGGSTFTVQSGGSATMIAGAKIAYLYGTRVINGGHMHGYITTVNAFCGSLAKSMVASAGSWEAGDPVVPPELVEGWFILYPNPASERVTLLDRGVTAGGPVLVEFFDMHGARILTAGYTNEPSHVFSLCELPAGLYLVKVIANGRVESFKLVVVR